MGALERITVQVSTEVADAMRRSVDEGAYESADQIVDDVLRAWARTQHPDSEGLAKVRAAVRRSDESGPGIPADQVYARLRARIAAVRQADR